VTTRQGGGGPLSVAAEVRAAVTWGVGAAAERLGMSASTLRTWERRYGIGPTHRTRGGHRRYTARDLDRVALMRRMLERGVAVRDAARVARGLDEASVVAAMAGEAARTEESPPAAGVVDALLAASVLLDPVGLGELCADALRRDGVVTAWTTVLVPALQRLGRAWADGEIGIESEHLASDRVAAELRAHTRTRASVDRTRATVVLAAAEDEEHHLPVLALEAALAEERVGCHVLGARVPATALSSLIRRLEPDVVFLWASMPRPADDETVRALAAAPAGTTVLLGGPGWPETLELPPGGHGPEHLPDIDTAVDRVLVGAGVRRRD
jgi:DNA-binding transcriptional MerR regulator